MLAGPGYLARLNDPTPATRAIQAHFSNVTRGLCSVRHRTGTADGGYVLAAAVVRDSSEAPFPSAALTRWCDEVVGDLGGVAATWAETEQQASRTETAEKRERSDANDIPDVVLLAEASRLAPLKAAARHLDGIVGEGASLRWLRRPGLYRLEMERLADRHVQDKL